MADKSTIHRAAISLADVNRGIYRDLQLTLARHPSETPHRLLARLLAYTLCFEEGLAFTRGICEGETPDIWLRDTDGRIEHWIEVGIPTPERLGRACRTARRVTLFVYGRQCRRWETMHLEALGRHRNLSIHRLPDSLLEALSQELHRSLRWTVTVTADRVYLASEGRDLEAEVESLQGSLTTAL